MTLQESIKKEIDEMSYAEMLSRWRFSKVPEPIFQGEIGEYFSKIMFEKRQQLKPDEHAKISKEIGW